MANDQANGDKESVDMSVIDTLLDPPTTSAPESDLPSPVWRVRLRKMQGLTQTQIATALGVTTGAVSTWERGRFEPRGTAREQYVELLRRIAKRFGVDPFEEGRPE